MPQRPTLVPTQVTLTISDNPDFVPRYGRQVIRAGGKYTDPRGHKNRLVTLPGGNDALVDAIAAGFAAGRVDIHVLRWAADGFDDRLSQALNDPEHLDLHWDRSPGITASQAVLAKGRAVSAGFDWDAHLAKCGARDGRRDAAGAFPTPLPVPVPVPLPLPLPVRILDRTSHASATASAMDAAMRDIAEEAVRILEGEDDLGVLKALAGRYRRLRAADRGDDATERARIDGFRDRSR